jgi:hypothetical protein
MDLLNIPLEEHMYLWQPPVVFAAPYPVFFRCACGRRFTFRRIGFHS